MDAILGKTERQKSSSQNACKSPSKFNRTQQLYAHITKTDQNTITADH